MGSAGCRGQESGAPSGSAPGGLPTKEPNVARLVPREGAVDDSNRPRPVDGELPHQQALLTAVDAECWIEAARHHQRRSECPPAIARMREPEALRMVPSVGEELPDHVEIVLTVHTQRREM